MKTARSANFFGTLANGKPETELKSDTSKREGHLPF